LVKLELRVEKLPPSNPVAPALRVGSWACWRIFAVDHMPWSLMARTRRSCWTLPFVVPGLIRHESGGLNSWRNPSAERDVRTSSH
jgi:hypothetical protein